MLLIGVGTGNDVSVSGSVQVIRTSLNECFEELHDPWRLEASQIEQMLLTSTDMRVVFASHGKQSALVDATKDRSPYLSGVHACLLRNFYVLAYACSTGVSLGEEFAQEAYLFIGFDTTISAPPDTNSACYSDVKSFITTLLHFVKNHVFQCASGTESACREVINYLRKQALESESRFDYEDGSILPADDLIAIRQFKSSPVAWVKGVAQPIKPEGAPSKPSLW